MALKIRGFVVVGAKFLGLLLLAPKMSGFIVGGPKSELYNACPGKRLDTGIAYMYYM